MNLIQLIGCRRADDELSRNYCEFNFFSDLKLEYYCEYYLKILPQESPE